MKKKFVGWDDYLSEVDKMIKYAKEHMNDAQVVVGLTRGGLPPAVILSHFLDLPMIAFDPHLLHANGSEREPVRLPFSPAVIKKIILVDDIADTGKTFLKCTKFFRSRGFDCRTMSVFMNEPISEYSPDYSGLDSEQKWVVFPYEKE